MAALFTDKSGMNPKKNFATGDLAANIDIATEQEKQLNQGIHKVMD